MKISQKEPLAQRSIDENYSVFSDRRPGKNNNPLNYHPDKENINSSCMLRSVTENSDQNNYLIGNIGHRQGYPFNGESKAGTKPFYLSDNYQESFGVVMKKK